jgi:hypothetical protein
MDYDNLILTVLSVLVGGLITWVASYVYYKKAGDELRSEVDKLRGLAELVLYIQLHPDADVSPKSDEQGRIIGLNVSAKGQA